MHNTKDCDGCSIEYWSQYECPYCENHHSRKIMTRWGNLSSQAKECKEKYGCGTCIDWCSCCPICGSVDHSSAKEHRKIRAEAKAIAEAKAKYQADQLAKGINDYGSLFREELKVA